MQVNTSSLLPESHSSQSSEAKKSHFHIPTLDGFRAIAFLLVFIAHSGLGHLFPGGSFGVTIFFFLSGYLITTLLRREFENTGRIALKRWYVRRLLRILPLFYLVLLLGLLLVQLGLMQESWATLNPASVIAQALHWSNYWMISQGETQLIPGSTVLWSLAVEAHFYLLFPWLFLGLQRLNLSPKQQAAVIWGLCGLVLLWRCLLVFGFQVSENRTYMATDTRIDGILFGCALALHHNPALDPPLGRDRHWLGFGFPAALTLLASTLLIRSPEFRETFRYSLQGIALYPVFITAIRCAQRPLFRGLDHPWLGLLGRLSYPLYLTHFILIHALIKALPDLPVPERALLALVVSAILSWLLDKVLEQPLQHLRQRIRTVA